MQRGNRMQRCVRCQRVRNLALLTRNARYSPTANTVRVYRQALTAHRQGKAAYWLATVAGGITLRMPQTILQRFGTTRQETNGSVRVCVDCKTDVPTATVTQKVRTLRIVPCPQHYQRAAGD